MPVPTSNITPSTDFQQLQSLFLSLRKPYGPGEVVRYNLAYHRAYPQMAQDERRRSEEWADALIAGMKTDEQIGGRGG